MDIVKEKLDIETIEKNKRFSAYLEANELLKSLHNNPNFTIEFALGYSRKNVKPEIK